MFDAPSRPMISFTRQVFLFFLRLPFYSLYCFVSFFFCTLLDYAADQKTRLKPFLKKVFFYVIMWIEMISGWEFSFFLFFSQQIRENL